MIKRCLLILGTGLVLGLQGCLGFGVNYPKLFNPVVGTYKSDVMAKFGPPKSIEAKDGYSMYYWQSILSSDGFVPIDKVTSSLDGHGYYLEERPLKVKGICALALRIDPYGYVLDWGLRGSDDACAWFVSRVKQTKAIKS